MPGFGQLHDLGVWWRLNKFIIISKMIINCINSLWVFSKLKIIHVYITLIESCKDQTYFSSFSSKFKIAFSVKFAFSAKLLLDVLRVSNFLLNSLFCAKRYVIRSFLLSIYSKTLLTTYVYYSYLLSNSSYYAFRHTAQSSPSSPWWSLSI